MRCKKPSSPESLLAVSELWVQKADLKRRIEELTWRLLEKLSAQKRTFAEKRDTEDNEADIEKLTEQVRQLSVRVIELKGKIMEDKKAVLDPNVKLKAA